MCRTLLSAVLLGLAMAKPAGAAASCSVPQPQVTVTIDMPSPTIDNSLPQPALQRLAGAYHHGGRTQGLYRGDLRWTWRATTHRTTVGGEACVAVETVAITITMPMRRIYVTRERRPGTCAYDSVLAHERKHQRIDDRVVDDYVPRLRQAAASALDAPPAPVPAAQADTAEAALTHRLGAAIERVFAELARARSARQAAIDTPAEYNRVRAVCG